MSGEQVAKELYTLAHQHVGRENTLYRIFYYDCYPFKKKMHHPITNRAIDFTQTPEYNFRYCPKKCVTIISHIFHFVQNYLLSFQHLH